MPSLNEPQAEVAISGPFDTYNKRQTERPRTLPKGLAFKGVGFQQLHKAIAVERPWPLAQPLKAAIARGPDGRWFSRRVPS